MFLKRLVPDAYIPSIYELDHEDLKAKNKKGIITDLDNTLVEWRAPQATPKLAQWLKDMEQAGWKIVVVSNNNEKRVQAFCEPLGVSFIHSAKKPMQKAFRQAQEQMELEPDEVVVIGDQLFTDVLGGNRMGYYTVLVVPVADTDGFFTRFNRKVERVAFSAMKRHGLLNQQDGKEDR